MNRTSYLVYALVLPVVIVVLSVKVASAAQVVKRDALQASVVEVNVLPTNGLGGGEKPPGCDELRFFERTITMEADGAQTVFAVDMDRDGDIDILSASFNDDKIAWYQNTDGLGAYGPQRVISNISDGAKSVFAVDLDGDGDPDVLSASSNDNTITRFMCGLGLCRFGRLITSNAIGATDVTAADIDGDGDIDVLSASIFDDTIAWYENIQGQGVFGTARVISDSAGAPIAIFVADLDADGDLDVLSASSGSDRILWYENTDGAGTFGDGRVITAVTNVPTSVFAADLDGDGDLDVLSASSSDDTIAWYENLDGSGTFGSQQIITTNAAGAQSVFAIDLDNDGDVDVLSASLLDNKIAWYENLDGLGAFGPQHIITTHANGARSVFAADLDGDGDADVIYASDDDDTIAWYENADGTPPDCNDNGIPDGCDIADGTTQDCNLNGIPDVCDLDTMDCDGNGQVDECEFVVAMFPDCNDNDIHDGCEIAEKLTPDCNVNGIPDSCDIADELSTDCNHNDVPDECEPYLPDCNGNKVPDTCDIAHGHSSDCDRDGVPDECDPNASDCNENGVIDECDIAAGRSADCNSSGVPDECELEALDCDGNGQIDACDLADGTHLDCNSNGVPDVCDIADGRSDDCNNNAIPDDCDLETLDCDGNGQVDECEVAVALFRDCNDNGVNDYCELAEGLTPDCNANGIPDECDVAGGQDCNGNGVPDACDLLSDRHVISDLAHGAGSVFAADVDGDGDTDVLSTSWFDDTVVWYENTDGRGAFGAPKIITTTAEGARSVFAADIDGDGDADVLSASAIDDKIAWYENTDGLGTFGLQSVITTGADGATSVFAADLDGDGDTDVISVSYNDDNIAWYENIDGRGAFGSPRAITTEANGSASVFAADVDGDGDLDVLSASAWNGTVAWYENVDGLGTFGLPRIITTITERASSVFAMDLDGDGDVDVLSASKGDDTIAWYENEDGRGNFGPQLTITSNADAASSVFASDMDGDGDADVASASWNKIEWYENTDGAGAFGPPRILTTDVVNAFSVFVADLDGQGSLEVLSASWNDRTIAWYGNIFVSQDCNANGVPDECDIADQTSGDCNNNGRPDECDFAEPTADCDSNGKLDCCELADGSAQDCNANGLPDTCDLETLDCDGNGLVDECELADGVTLDCNANHRPDSCDSTPFFEDVGRTVVTTNAEYILSVFATDLNGDGAPDIISAADSENGIVWYENTDGLGRFGPERPIASDGSSADSVVASDLDGDGDQDILSASFYEDRLAWYENTDGRGTFGPPRDIPIDVTEIASIYAIDLDGDGDVDVLLASERDGIIAWHENTDGAGGFGSQRIISMSAEGAQSVFAADLDGDGDFDVLSASAYDDKIAWYENIDGLGSFGGQRLIDSRAKSATVVLAADFDGDGDTDVLSASSYDDFIVWYQNIDGSGTFSPGRPIDRAVHGLVSIVTGDFDRDGDVDIIVGLEYNDGLVWYENLDGLGTFGPQRPAVDLIYGITSIFAADLDGDRDLDVVVASEEGYVLAWHENSLVSPDCNGNDIPDECDIADLTSTDCNNNGQPDECEADGDADGIPDVCDMCPDSSFVDSIIINGCDVGVENVLFDDGCTMADAIDACETSARNHGALTSCITDVANTWKRQSFITGREFGAMISCAGSGQSTKNTLRGASRTDARKN